MINSDKVVWFRNLFRLPTCKIPTGKSKDADCENCKYLEGRIERCRDARLGNEKVINDNVICDYWKKEFSGVEPCDYWKKNV